MTDPVGRSAPGQINELLIWQQPHPIIFATLEYRYSPFPTAHSVLEKWRDVVVETANFMAAFAWFNASTGFYDLGPAMYVVSEDTSPNITRNPSFELAQWAWAFDLASTWVSSLGEDVPAQWTSVRRHLALPTVQNNTYVVYDGIEDTFWDDPDYTNDHPSLVGESQFLFGKQPPAHLFIEQAFTDGCRQSQVLSIS